MTLKYKTSIDAGDNTFQARVFNWAGNQPGNTLLYDNTATAIEGWLEVDVSSNIINVDGDFVVGFGSVNEQTYISYDGNLNNGRSWDWDEGTTSWTSWDEAYLIRAVVQYSDGTLAELGGGKDLLGYNLYRDNVQVNTSLILNTNTTDNLPGWGTFEYNVTAVYDEGQSAFSNTFTLHYYLGIEELQQIDVKVFPNPALDHFMIESDEQIRLVSLHSLDGKKLVSAENTGLNYKMDVSGLNTGLYILKIQNDKGTGIFKVLVR